MKVSDIKPTNRFFGLFIGQSGSGKTCAALSFPTPGLVLDIDKRITGGLEAQRWLPPGKLSEWDVIQYPSGQGFTAVENKLEQIGNDIANGTNKLKTLVIDSLTTESDLLITDALDKISAVKTIGTMKIPGPAHYGYEQVGMAQVIQYLKDFPINVICSAHTIPRWGKPPGGNEYSDNVVVGKQLALRDRVGVRQEINFNEVYEFYKVKSAGTIYHKVCFQDGDMAKTAYASKLPTKEINITNIDFYSTWCHYIDPGKQ